jgi:hypothetical protein
MSRGSGSAYHHLIDLQARFCPSPQATGGFLEALRVQAYGILISIESDDWAEQCESKTMKILMDKTLRFWVDVALEHIKSDHTNLSVSC